MIVEKAFIPNICPSKHFAIIYLFINEYFLQKFPGSDHICFLRHRGDKHNDRDCRIVLFLIHLHRIHKEHIHR